MASAIPCLRCRATTQADAHAQSVSCPFCSLVLPPPSSAAWLVSRAGAQPFGPYTIDQLAGHVATGTVIATDSVWHEGAPGWVAVSELSALAGGAPAPTPPLPPAHDPYAGQPYGGQPYQPQPGQPYGGAPGQPPYGQPGYGSPYGPYGPGPHGGPPPAGSSGVGLIISRAFDWNLRHLKVDPAEEARLGFRAIHDENARRYLVWRRSVLLFIAVPMAVSALLGTIDLFGVTWAQFSALGVIITLLKLAILFLLPATAFMAAQSWDDQRKSRRILLIGWSIALVTPLVIALLPAKWLYSAAAVQQAAGPAGQVGQADAVFAMLGAGTAYVTLMPAVLSLIPGVLRGCLRIKSLLPQAVLPGLFLIAATPLYVLFLMVVFTIINQFAGNIFLLLGVAAFIASSVIYLFYAGPFMRPLRSEEEFAKIGSVQLYATIIMGVGVVLFIIYAFTATLPFPLPTGGFPTLIGSAGTSLLRPWDPQIYQFMLDFIVRSLFTTVVIADLFMLMNVALWRNTKVIEGTPEGQNYDQIMANIEETGGAGIVSGNTIFRGGQ